MNHPKSSLPRRTFPLAALVTIALFNPAMATDIELPSTPFEPNAQSTVEAIERGLQSDDAFRWTAAAQQLSLLLDREGPTAIPFQRLVIAHQDRLSSALGKASDSAAATSLSGRLNALLGTTAQELKGHPVEGNADTFTTDVELAASSNWYGLTTQADQIYTLQLPECHGGALAVLTDAQGKVLGAESSDPGLPTLLTFAGKPKAQIRLRLFAGDQCSNTQTLTWSAIPTSGLLLPNTAEQAHVIEPDRDYRVMATSSAAVWVRFADKVSGTYTLQTSTLPAGVDTVLSAYAADNPSEVAATDDDSAGELASRLQYVSFGRSPMLYQASLLSGSGVFTLRASREETPSVRPGVEVQPMQFAGGDVLWRKLEVKAGTAYRIQTLAAEGASLDTILAIYDGHGAAPTAENDDNDGDLYASLDYFASEDGEIVLSVRELSGSAGGFGLQITELTESTACPAGNVCFKQPKGD